MSRIIIFGGGWSGLLASIKVKSLYPRSEVICIDKSFDGGLLRSEIIDGHLFDTGGSHVVFSKNQKVISSMLSMGNKWVKRKRAAYILLNNHFVPYPFENGIYLLPQKEE
jgi:protoporphyrinogen oxidase